MKLPRIGHLAFSFGITILVALGIVGYLATTGEQMARRHTPQIDAAMEIKLNATMAHLWFEEIISGDSNELIEDVWNYLDESDWYARALLEGGNNQEGTFVPLESPKMRRQIESVRKSLAMFRVIAEQRFANYAASLPGSGIDQEFDRIFDGFIEEADQVESLLQQSIANELRKFEQTALFLVIMLIGTGSVVALTLFRMERQRTLHLSTIEQRNKEIETRNAELDYLAHFDNLSGLPNRTLFTDRLEQAISHARRKSSCVAVLFIDLDRFKKVNDRLGHARGDELLTLTAKRLRKCLREDDSVARLGGDEFTVILTDMENRDKASKAASSVAQNITAELSKPFNLDGQQANISASVGIAVYPFDARDADELIINADHAMYEAKQKAPGNFRFHSQEINVRVRRELQIEHELHNAIQEEQFTVYYQPQWDLHNESISGFEALVRWEHPQEGLLLPDSFIHIAETTGLIEQLDLMVMKSVCRQQRDWSEQGLNPGKLAINISAVMFGKPDIAKMISAAITEYCISSHDLEVELTESAMLQDITHTQHIFNQLSRIGILLAIDDFGIGYSSMAYLQNFPAKVLKIDRSFIQDIDKSQTAKAIVLSMLELARNMKMEVIAEGIETPGEKAFIKSTGCRYGQGYLLGKPMTADQAHALLISRQEDNVTMLPPRIN
ncbi:MAG: EAL domain-containing protein [Candidatus Thiodiazotropha endolucinida]